MISVPSVFFRPSDRADESDAAREKFSVSSECAFGFFVTFLYWPFVLFRPSDRADESDAAREKFSVSGASVLSY
jgi:hypothetical protein